jgi:hypothetical protein
MVKIIAGYPACGKTYCTQHSDNTIDLEYSHYAWIEDENGKKLRNKKGDKIKNFAFPQNYLNEIISNYQKYKQDENKNWYIFINAHPEILSNLIRHSIPITVVIPQDNLKNKWISRFYDRNDDDCFIKQQEENYDVWVDELRANANNFTKLIELCEDEYISDIINFL